MTDIPNTEYITINKSGVFVGGKPVTHYHGEKPDIFLTEQDFREIQMVFADVEELHIGMFDTKGSYAVPGKPSGRFGPNSWCRVKFRNGTTGNWVMVEPNASLFRCAFVNRCNNYFCLRADLRSAVMKQNKQYDVVKVVELGKYRFTVEKIAQKVR